MAYDFPASPTVGQIFTAGTTNFQWNGYAWIMQSGNIGPQGPEGPIGPQGPQGIQGPQGGLTGAPMDGAEYVIVNGVYRKKAQSFVLDGLTNFDLAMPAGARAVRCYATLMPSNPAVASNSIIMRASLDGTTFLQGAADYHYAGFIHYSGSSGFGQLGSATPAFMYLAFNNDSNIVQEVIDFKLSLVRPTVPSNQPWYGMVNWCSYQSAGANAYNTGQMRIGVMNTSAGAVTTLKALRISHAISGAFGSPSYLEASWMY